MTEVLSALLRHSSGDWGDVDEESWEQNERSLHTRHTLFSVYHVPDGEKFWIITEWDRSVTTVLMPEDH